MLILLSNFKRIEIFMQYCEETLKKGKSTLNCKEQKQNPSRGTKVVAEQVCRVLVFQQSFHVTPTAPDAHKYFTYAKYIFL